MRKNPRLPLNLTLFVARHLSDTVSTFTRPVDKPGFRLACRRCPAPVPHQGFDARPVFSGQPVRQFPEHDMVDAPERTRCEVGELVESRPSRQLTVQAVDHVDLAKVMIAGENLGQFASERLGLLLGYRRDDGQWSRARSVGRTPRTGVPLPSAIAGHSPVRRRRAASPPAVRAAASKAVSHRVPP